MQYLKFYLAPIYLCMMASSLLIGGLNGLLIAFLIVVSIVIGELFLGDDDSAINRIYDAKLGDAKESIDVESVTIDEYFKENDELINFIKIDSEGSEVKIINGMKQFLSRNQELVMMTEFFPFLIKKSGDEPNQYLKSLEKFVFSLYNILDKNEKTNKINSENFLESGINSEYCTNLLCIKQ